MTTESGRCPDGSGSRASHRAAKASRPEASIPNAVWRSLATAPKGQRILVMCDSDAPWPVMIARWNGEKWSSQDEATSGKTWSVRGWAPLPDPAPIAHQCSFCAKELSEVAKLIAGPMVFICNECVAICDEIMEAERAASAIEAATAGETPQSGSTEGESAVAESQTPDNSRTTP